MFVDLPLGHTTGLPNDPDGQRQILTAGLEAAVSMTVPGAVADLDFRFVDDDWKASPLSWSRKRQDGGLAGQNGGDTRTGRSDQPVYQSDDDRLAAESG